MEIRTLRYFLAVAREENITRAAELLYVTQPTLSKQLKFLSLDDITGGDIYFGLAESYQIRYLARKSTITSCSLKRTISGRSSPLIRLWRKRNKS